MGSADNNSEPAISTPLSVVWAAAISLIFVIGTFCAFYFGEYPRLVRLTGSLAPASGLSVVSPAAAGYVTSIDAKEGEYVSEGQLLFRIAAPADSVAAASVGADITDEIADQQQQIASDIAQLKDLAATRREITEASIAGLRRELAMLSEEVQLAQERLTLSDEQAKRLAELSVQGHVSKAQLDEAAHARLGLRSTLLELERTKKAKELQIFAEERALQENDVSTSLQLSALDAKRSELNQLLVERKRIASPDIVAPIAGHLLGFQVHLGQQISPGEPLAFIVRRGSRLNAELCATGNQIPQIRVGQRVRLRYPAFPLEKYGTYSGTVTTASRVVPPSAPTQCFLVRVRLNDQSVRNGDEQIPLVAGMPVSADVRVDDRTLLELVFGPFLRMKESI